MLKRLITVLLLLLISNIVLPCTLLQEKKIPNVWLQLADTRTASTLQWVTLILIGNLLCEGSVEWRYLQRCSATAMYYAQNPDPNTLQILKSHDFCFLGAINENAWAFSSSTGDGVGQTMWIEGAFPTRHSLVKIMQGMDDIHNSSVHILNTAYKELFNLTDVMITKVVTVLEPWSVLRKCCGSQMSASWRLSLHGESDLKTHDCYGHDIKSVETRYAHSSPYTHSPPIYPIHTLPPYKVYRSTSRVRFAPP